MAKITNGMVAIEIVERKTGKIVLAGAVSAALGAGGLDKKMRSPTLTVRALGPAAKKGK